MVLENFTKNGKCENCARCCSNILFSTKEDIDRVKRYMKENNIILKSPYSVLNTEYKANCPFLDENKKCKIYPARLTVCRTFSCNEELHEEMNYKGTKIIDMLDTFGENLYYPCKPDLSIANKEWKEKLEGIYD